MLYAFIAYILVVGLLVVGLCRAAARGDRMADDAHFAATGKRLFDQPDMPMTSAQEPVPAKA